MMRARQARPADADAVVAARGDDARHVRAVAVVVCRIAVAVDEVGAVDIVDEAVAVVVDPVARHLARVASRGWAPGRDALRSTPVSTTATVTSPPVIRVHAAGGAHRPVAPQRPLVGELGVGSRRGGGRGRAEGRAGSGERRDAVEGMKHPCCEGSGTPVHGRCCTHRPSRGRACHNAASDGRLSYPAAGRVS